MKREIPNALSAEVLDRYDIVDNTFKQEVKANPKDRITVEIGDSKQPDFKPQAKIMRWDNEVNFSLRAEEHPDAIVETEGKLIKYKTPEYEVHQYELDPDDINSDGGLEFEWILPHKPATNVLTATIQTKGLNFFYQPPLTPAEIAEGASRPENVEGSYAVYHKTKGGINRSDGMEYKVGKAFHIYRPKVTDANGVETWGELNIDEQKGEITVTIDQTWLNNAVYPVVVDPTFGYTSSGASSQDIEDRLHGSRHTTSQSGKIYDIKAYTSVSTASKSIAFAIYDSSLNKITNGNSGTASTSSLALYRCTFVTMPTLSNATEYVLAIAGASGAGSHSLRYDAGTANQSLGVAFTYNATLLDPISGHANNSNVYSIYANFYTPGSGTELIVKVGASADDAYEVAGVVTLTDTEQISDTTNEYHGFRFQNVTIPQGATINNAYLRLFISSITSDEPLHRLWGNDVDNAGVFTTDANNISGRTPTTAAVDWDTSVGAGGANVSSDTGAFWGDDGVDGISLDIKTIIQEIIDRGGWASGNSIVLFTTQHTSDSLQDLGVNYYDLDPSWGAELWLYYTASGESTPTKGIYMTTNTMFWGS